MTALHVRQDGPHDAPTLLLVHGTAASLRTWHPLIPLLTSKHRVISLDLPGCGQSSPPPDANYSIPDQANAVAATLASLAVSRTVVVGHSSGGAIATALAEQHPGLVTATALINTGPDLTAHTAPELTVTPQQWPTLTDEQLRQLLSPAFAPGHHIPQWFVDEARTTNLHAFAATTQALRTYLTEQPLPPRLTSLTKPLLVIFGQDDQRWRSSSATQYQAVPGAVLELWPGVGHSPNLEDPHRTAAAVLAFTAPR